MFFVAVATDYDNTIAEHGDVNPETLAAIEKLKQSGRRMILVTGRELPDLLNVFPQNDLFDLIVAENGALLYDPAAKGEEPLGPPPPEAFIQRLREAGVTPLSVGRTIVATWEPNETVVLQLIRELGLELQIIFNKGAVMVLPPNINKASGLAAALERLSLSPYNVVGIGDAENDHAFLSLCGCGVAVANALPSVKQKADHVTRGAVGAGFIELAELLEGGDLRELSVPANRPVAGIGVDERSLPLDPRDGPLLVAGSSGGGKSTVVTAYLEQIHRLSYQFCVIDPEGDYSELGDAVVLGDAGTAPRLDEIITLLSRPDVSLVVNLLGIKAADRPRFFASLLPELARLRAKTGRPHWIVIDEAHHMLPASWEPAPATLPREMPATILVTVHPESLAEEVIRSVSSVVGVGAEPREAVARFCAARGEPEPPEIPVDRDAHQAYYWRAGNAQAITIHPPEGERRRHLRKYAEGELGEDKSFYFRGPENKLNLRAHNLIIFVQMAEGVDADTWVHHLRRGDYSRWFEEAIKDPGLAEEARAIEQHEELDAAASRERITELITQRYTAPAKSEA
jgi:hypothetical protein